MDGWYCKLFVLLGIIDINMSKRSSRDDNTVVRIGFLYMIPLVYHSLQAIVIFLS